MGLVISVINMGNFITHLGISSFWGQSMSHYYYIHPFIFV